MAIRAMLKLKGIQQGEIKGETRLRGFEGQIELISVKHQFNIPTDAATLQPTGKRQYQPIEVLKAVDRVTPLLINAAVNNEIFVEFALDFFGSEPATGVFKKLYSIFLKGARVSANFLNMPNQLDADLHSQPLQETIRFVFEEIEWKWHPANTVAQDRLARNE